MKPVELFEEQRIKAIATLVELGFAKYVNEMDLYHGRAGDGSDWEVKPNFSNGGNATQHHNVNAVDGLYAGSKTTASKFAQARTSGLNPNAEVHKIVSFDESAVVFDFDFDVSSLSSANKQKYYDAIETLTHIGLTQLNPIKFEYSEAWDIVIKKFKEYQTRYNISVLPNDLVEIIISDLKFEQSIKQIFQCNSTALRQFVYGLIGSYNARAILKLSPTAVLNKYINGKTTIQFSNSPKNYTIDHNFISAWCSVNHIVGIKERVDSATIRETIPICHLFDTKKVVSERQRGMMHAKMLDRYGEITNSLDKVVDKKTAKILTTGNAKEVMDYIRQDKKCAELYDKSCHIWEGWSIGQHTTSTIDFFDSYYTEQIPENLRPFIKVCLLTHDIGKSFAVEQNRPQSEMNTKYSKYVFDALSVHRKYRDLINFIISDSQTFTTAILLNKGDKKLLANQLKHACQEAFIKAFGRIPSEKEMSGLSKICVTLQECDSGAYTRYAKINENGRTIGGGNDRFTQSFELNSRGDPRLKNFTEDLTV